MQLSHLTDADVRALRESDELRYGDIGEVAARAAQLERVRRVAAALEEED